MLKKTSFAQMCFYETKPFGCLLLSLAALKVGDATLGLLSASLLSVCSVLILYWRFSHRI